MSRWKKKLDKSWLACSQSRHSGSEATTSAQLPSLFLSMHFLSHWLFCQCNDSPTATAAAAAARAMPPSSSSSRASAAELEIPNCQPRYTTLAIPDKAVGSYCTARQILAEKKVEHQNLLALHSPYGAHFVASLLVFLGLEKFSKILDKRTSCPETGCFFMEMNDGMTLCFHFKKSSRKMFAMFYGGFRTTKKLRASARLHWRCFKIDAMKLDLGPS